MQINPNEWNQKNAFIDKYGIPGSVLKIIATLSMLIDHTGAVIVKTLRLQAYRQGLTDLYSFYVKLYYYMRRIGRLAFPIYCFLLIEGFLHTKNVKKYASRLFLFALISDIPFDFALHYGEPLLNKQNVFFTLLIGLLVIWGVEEMKGLLPVQIFLLSAGMILAIFIRSDYSYHGVFLIELLYLTRKYREAQCLLGGTYMQIYEKMPTPLAFIPIYLYNGKRGRQIKYLFYAVYPAHLLILGIINRLIS